jgi:hypothetical protein
VVGRPLDVEEAIDAVLPQQIDEPHERHLGGVPPAVEHRLAREEPSDRDPVEAAGERPVVERPGLDAVGPPESVEPAVGVADLRCDPAVGTVGLGAGLDHLVEGGVDPDLEAATRRSQRSRRPQPVERQDASRVG